MKKWQKWGILICIISVLVGRYGHILYGSFGIDSDGYVADQKGKKIAYKLHGAYEQAEIDRCFEDLGFDPDNLNTLLKNLKTGTLTASPALKKCIEMKAEGYASPKKDAKRLLKAVRGVFKDKKPELVMPPITYTPGEVGPQQDLIVYVPGNNEPYFVECSGSYQQVWKKNGRDKWCRIGCNGIYTVGATSNEVAKMPIGNAHKYGALLINGQYAFNKMHIEKRLRINVNIPQTHGEFKYLKGSLTIKIVRLQ